MKGLKKISVLGLGLIAVGTLASCSVLATGNKLDAVPEAAVETYPEVNYDYNYSSSSSALSNIILDTTNVQTTFYLGDEFNCDNLIVKARYLMTVDGKRKAVDYVIDDYSIDTSEVNMYIAGTYPVTIQYRSGTILKEKSYDITVENNNYEGVPNINYFSGIDMKWTTAMKSNSNFITTSSQDNMLFIYVDPTDGATDNIKSLITTGSFEVTAYLTSNDATGNPTVSTYKNWKNYATLDVSSLDLTTPGTYMAKLTLTLPESIAKTDIEIKTTGFVMITVVDVVTEISYAGYYENGELKSGQQKTYNASLDTFDYSDLAFNVNYYSGVKTIRVGDEPSLFQFSNVCPYIFGSRGLTVTFTEADLKGNFPSCNTSINVADSGYIYTAYNTPSDEDGNGGNPFTGVVAWDDSQSKYIDATISTETAISSDGLIVGNNIQGHNSAASYEGSSFAYRVKITKNTGYITVKTTGAATIKYYVAYSTTAGTNAIVVDQDNNSICNNTFGVGTGTSGISSAFSITVDAAGEYKLYSTSGTLYLYGIVVATINEA